MQISLGFIVNLICTSLPWKNWSDNLDVPLILSATSSPNCRLNDHPLRIKKNSFMEFSTFLKNLVETVQSLGFHHDLQSTVYFQFALNKLQHKEKLQWSQFIIQNRITQPNLIVFNNWLREFALACDHMPADVQPNLRTTMQQRDGDSLPIWTNKAAITATSHRSRP